MGYYAQYTGGASDIMDYFNVALSTYHESSKNAYWGLNLIYYMNDEPDWMYFNTAETARTVNKIDVSGYTTLTCNFYGTVRGSGYSGGWQKAVVGICTEDASGSSLLNANNYHKKILSEPLTITSAGPRTMTLDLSDINGEYYVCFSIISYRYSAGSYGQSFYKMILN